MKASDGKKRSTHKSATKHNSSIVEQLRSQIPSSQSKRKRNDDNIPPLSQHSTQSSEGISELAPMAIEFNYDNEPTASQFDSTFNIDKDSDSVATENMENISKQLLCTRVDIKVKVPPHTNPEEKTVQVLQEFLKKLQSYDPKAKIAPWYERCSDHPIASPSDFIPRPSELEKFFPRIFFKEEGFTWYSGTRIIHSLPMPDLKQDMIRWLKKEGHGMFERMLQAADTTEIGWLVYSTWQMEAAVLAQAIESTINIKIGLRWKQVSTGSRERLPQQQQVKALHVEVATENRSVAQKALLSVYGRKNKGQFPNGIRLRFSLPIHSAHNLNTKAKLERLRARQQSWLSIYDKGYSWEISQLDHPINKKGPTLRQALLALMSTTDSQFPIFHSVDRSNYKASGICFQFLPEFADEARMTISNLVPLMRYKYGPSVLSLFSPSAVERVEGCEWDPETGTVVGQYDEEIAYLDESDPMSTYVTSSTIKPPSSTSSTAPTASSSTSAVNNTLHSASLLHDMDDDSVSTLGNATHTKWTPSPAINVAHPLTQRPPLLSPPNDDASTSSISTLTTRLTTMETQYRHISGDVQDIKTMLVGLAQANNHSTRVGPPTNATTAGRGSPSAGSGS